MSLPAYDDQNIFARILRGEIPCDKAVSYTHLTLPTTPYV